MRNSLTRNFTVLRPRFAGNLGLLAVMALSFTACSSQIAQDVELAVQEVDRIATQQDLARAALEKERQRVLEQEAREIEVAAERVRQAEQERKNAAEAESQRLVAEEQRQLEIRERQVAAEAEEQQRQQDAEAIALAQAERDGKIAKIAELQSQLDEIQLEASNSESTILALSAAIAAAEELLTVLTSEQAKYEEIDESGFTREPLAKELILELESRKEELVGQAAAQ